MWGFGADMFINQVMADFRRATHPFSKVSAMAQMVWEICTSKGCFCLNLRLWNRNSSSCMCSTLMSESKRDNSFATHIPRCKNFKLVPRWPETLLLHSHFWKTLAGHHLDNNVEWTFHCSKTTTQPFSHLSEPRNSWLHHTGKQSVPSHSSTLLSKLRMAVFSVDRNRLQMGMTAALLQTFTSPASRSFCCLSSKTSASTARVLVKTVIGHGSTLLGLTPKCVSSTSYNTQVACMALVLRRKSGISAL